MSAPRVFRFCAHFAGYTLFFLLGPIVSLLMVKFSYRLVSMLGVLLICISNISLGYSTSLVAMILSYSVLGGRCSTIIEIERVE